MRVIKFLISGGLAAVTELAVFMIFNYLAGGSLLLLAQTVSFLSGFVVSFFMQRRWVFKSNGSAKTEVGQYAVLALVNIILTNVVIYLLVQVLSLDATISKVIVMGMVAAWNYVIFSRLIFNNKDTKEKAED